MSQPPLEVVAERQYHLSDGRPFIVRWMKPIQSGQDWCCPYQFIHPDGFVYRDAGMGVDSAQAFYLALQGVAVKLYQQDAALYWFEPNDDLGLPLPESREDLRRDRAVEKSSKMELTPDNE